EFDRGATFLEGEGAYTGTGKRVVLSVLNRAELARLKEQVWEIDPRAFVIITDVTEVLGEGFAASVRKK
ncbi:MAG: YitT family protein, partial [Firmicutes bacterium]|nr:YitT family protein [Bacillota bacterium]